MLEGHAAGGAEGDLGSSVTASDALGRLLARESQVCYADSDEEFAEAFAAHVLKRVMHQQCESMGEFEKNATRVFGGC
jgi:hypothetical protein